MSHYGNYIKEREGFEIAENEKGFATYQITGEICYLRDIYVAAEFRKENVASALADKISEWAKQLGCKILVGSVCPGSLGDTASLKVLLAYGFQLSHLGDGLIYFKKEI